MKKILVIDDWKPLLTVTRAFLVKNGYDVTVASSPVQGLDLFERENFDLLIVDVMMPEMSGFEVVERVRKNPEKKDVKIIVATGRSDPLDSSIAKNHGADGFIPKPFTKEELLGKIKSLYS